jgi:protein TonB
MTTVARPPVITSSDRLSLTIFFAVVVHAIVILGLGFDINRSRNSDIIQSLEVTLVNTRSEKKPEEADYLAQVDHQGSGNTEEKVRASSPSSQKTATMSERTGKTPEQRLATAKPQPEVKADKRVMTAKESSHRVQVKQETEKPRPKRRISAQEIITRSMEMASLDAEIQQQRQAYAKRPRIKYISASTREYKYATYMEAWRAKVERIGRLNYPEEAKKRQIFGSLIMDVVLNSDGSVYQLQIKKSSGSKVLDDAAIRIVRLAAPFAPLPDNIREETEMLHITRTWIFRSGNRLMTR